MTSKKAQPELQSQSVTMKKILIALDYDPSARKVAEKGFSLARAMNAEAILLHVIANETYYSTLEFSPIMGFDSFNNTDFTNIVDVEGLKKASQYFLDKLKLHLGDDKLQTLIEEGDLADAILKTAKHLHVDVIVMGSHSRRWLEEILLGSVTEKVLNNTTVPLFIIPTKGRNS